MKKQLLTLFLVILLVCSSFTACGDDATLQAVIMKDQPTKTEYVIGETFDFTGATLEVTMSDGTIKVIDVTAEMLSGNLTFTKAGKQAITVIYTEAGVTKQAVIYVNVTDPTPVTTPLAEAKDNAKAELLAYYESMILATPSGKNAAGEDYPALTEDLATPAQNAYNAGVAAIDGAADAAAVYAAKAAAVAKLQSLDTYIDFYAAVQAGAIRTNFDTTYVPDRLFWINYAELRYNMEVLAARILRADSLDEIDALVATEDEVYENAENTVDDFAKLLVSFENMQLDLPTDDADDATDGDLLIFEEIMERIDILLDPNLTDESYAKEFIKRVKKYPAAGLDDVSGSICDGMLEILEARYNEDTETYNLFDYDFENDTAPMNSVAFDVAMSVYNILGARDEADAVGGVEEIVLAAVEAADEQAKLGLIYDLADADSVHNQILAAKDAFETWVKGYAVLEYNYDLVEGYDKLLAYATAFEKIGEAIDDADAITLDNIPNVIILNDQVKAAIEAVEAIAQEYADAKGIPVNARYIDATTGEAVYLIGNYQTLFTARTRYDQLQAAKDAANAVADATAGTTDGVATIIINKITGKTVVYAAETATEGAVAHTLVNNAKTAYEALLAQYEIETFAFNGVDVDSAETIAANLDAIFGAANVEAYEAAVARADQLTAAYNAGSAVIDKINLIESQALVLDRVAALEEANTAYETWKTTYALDDEDAFDLESIKNMLVVGTVDYYTSYTEHKAQIPAAVEELNELIDDLKALKAPTNIVASDKGAVAELRAAFEALVVTNGDTSADKAGTAKHVKWLAADGVTEVDGYDKLCRAEATLFGIDYVALLTADSGYNAKIKDMRDAYLALIGSAAGRADDALAITEMYSQAIAYISASSPDGFIADGGYDAETLVARIKAGKAIADIYDEAVKALDAFVAEEGAVEMAFRLAARYIVTEANGVYSLTIYAPSVYDASTILTVAGTTPASYGTITIDSTFGGNVVLVGFVADEVVYGEAEDDAVATLSLPVLTLQGVDVGVVTVNQPVVVVILADAAVAEVVTNAAAAVDYAPTADLNLTSFADVNVTAPNAKVVLNAKVANIAVSAKSVEARIGYKQTLEDFEEGELASYAVYLEATDAEEGKIGVITIKGVVVMTDNANTDPDATDIVTVVDPEFDWDKDIDFAWEGVWTEPIPPEMLEKEEWTDPIPPESLDEENWTDLVPPELLG